MTLSRPAALCTRIAAFALIALVAAASHAQGRFSVSADGQEVLDTTTQLTWRRCAEGLHWDGKTCAGKLMKFTYAAAKQQAASTAKGDGKGWRVPARDELVALVDMSVKKKPRIDVMAFPKTPSALFWASRPGSNDDLNAWLVNFTNGRVTGNAGMAKFALRLVRSKS